jgi:hypothetical protein
MLKKVLFTCAAFGALTLVFAAPSAANLEVSSQKVIGQAKGLTSEKETLKKEAAQNALKNEADVLVETEFFYEEEGDSIKVIATGYPAKHSLPAEKIKETNDFSLPKNDLPQPQYQSGLYISAKTQLSLPWSAVGGNVQVGWVVGRLFFAADFGAGIGNSDYVGDYSYQVWSDSTMPNYYCGGLSFGGRIQPNDLFQVILGATFGVHTRFDRDRDYSWYEYYTVVRKPVLVQGPMVKFLFGVKKFWFELSNDVVFGYSYGAYNIKAGVTYAPTKK